VDNADYEVSLIVRKIYEVLPDYEKDTGRLLTFEELPGRIETGR